MRLLLVFYLLIVSRLGFVAAVTKLLDHNFYLDTFISILVYSLLLILLGIRYMSKSIGFSDLIRNRKYATQRFGGLLRSLIYMKKSESKRQDTYPSLVEEKVKRYGNNILIKTH